MAAVPTPQPSREPKSRLARPWYALANLSERSVRLITAICAIVSVLTTLGIVVVLVAESVPFFREVSFREFYFTTVWAPNAGQFGMVPLLVGTLMITVGSALISVPLGLAAAIYLAEYAPQSVRKTVKPILELLAGIPTVVFGYFALFFVTPLLQRFINVDVYNAMAGAIVVGIMTLPLVSSLCEDAISAVPKALREGAYGLGATKSEVILRVVLPAALSGIMASFIIAVSRAVGETMAVTLAAGSNPTLNFNPAQSIQTITAYIAQTAGGDVARGTVEYNAIFALGLTLFALTLVMNILANRFVRKYRNTY